MCSPARASSCWTLSTLPVPAYAHDSSVTWAYLDILSFTVLATCTSHSRVTRQLLLLLRCFFLELSDNRLLNLVNVVLVCLLWALNILQMLGPTIVDASCSVLHTDCFRGKDSVTVSFCRQRNTNMNGCWETSCAYKNDHQEVHDTLVQQSDNSISTVGTNTGVARQLAL